MDTLIFDSLTYEPLAEETKNNKKKLNKQNSENDSLTKEKFNIITIITDTIKKEINNDNQEKDIFVPGITRDKFKQFQEYRDNHQKRFFHFLEKDIFNDSNKLISNSVIFSDQDNDTGHLLSFDNIEMQSFNKNDNYNTNYFEYYKEVNILYEELLSNFSNLKILQQTRLKPKFEDEDSTNKKLDKEIKKIMLILMKKIKFCEIYIDNISKSKIPDNEIQIKENIKLLLVEKIKDISNEIRKNEQQFMKYLKDMGGEHFSSYNIKDINSTDDEGYNSDEGGVSTSNNFLFVHDDDVNYQLKKREESINVIVGSIKELSCLFKDMQVIVQEQGTILDRIDYNIDVAAENSKNAKKYLVKAEEAQGGNCYRNMIMILMIVIFVETIMFITKYL